MVPIMSCFHNVISVRYKNNHFFFIFFYILRFHGPLATCQEWRPAECLFSEMDAPLHSAVPPCLPVSAGSTQITCCVYLHTRACIYFLFFLFLRHSRGQAVGVALTLSAFVQAHLQQLWGWVLVDLDRGVLNHSWLFEKQKGEIWGRGLEFKGQKGTAWKRKIELENSWFLSKLMREPQVIIPSADKILDILDCREWIAYCVCFGVVKEQYVLYSPTGGIWSQVGGSGRSNHSIVI